MSELDADPFVVHRIIEKEITELRDWEPYHLARAIQEALLAAGYVIAVDPSPEALLRRSEAALAPLSE